MLGAAPVAHAEDTDEMLLATRWPEVPPDRSPSFEDQVTDHLSALGNYAGRGLSSITGDVVSLHVDGRHNSARLGISSGGEGHLLTFKLDSNVLFSQGQAHIDAKLSLGVGCHHVEMNLPAMDIVPDNWHGQDLVVVDINFLKRSF